MSRGGFTLIEIVIAASLALFIMLGSFAVLGSLAGVQRQNLTKSAVVGWSAASLSAMSSDFAQANVLVLPNSSAVNSNTLAFCRNWSKIQGGALDPDPSDPTTTIVYCYLPGSQVCTGGLYRYEIAGSCLAPSDARLACPASYAKEAVASGVCLDGSHSTIFGYNSAVGGVGVNFTVGNPAPTTNLKVPESMTFNATLLSQQQLEVD